MGISHNKRNCSPPCSGGSDSTKHRSGYGIFLHHFLPALAFAYAKPKAGKTLIIWIVRRNLRNGC